VVYHTLLTRTRVCVFVCSHLHQRRLRTGVSGQL